MLSPHPRAALEYWFFKVNAGNIALLVDWIARRGEYVLRVSIHSPYKREVLFHPLKTFPDSNNYLRPEHTQGQVGEVTWNLAIDLNDNWITPDLFPAKLLRIPDMTLTSAPLATFTGWIRHGSEVVKFQEARGLVSQYWGRQLPPEWWWVSANQFEQPGFAVECMVIRTRLWGTPIEFPFAYCYLSQPHDQELVIAPFRLAKVKGSPERFEIEIRRLGRDSIFLTATGRDYTDLGDNIMNTLVGDLEVREGNRLLAKAIGTAGLERRNRQ